MKNLAALIAEVMTLILTGGNRTSALNVRTLVNDILASIPTWLDGGMNFHEQIGYDGTVIPTNPNAFVPLSMITSGTAKTHFINSTWSNVGGQDVYSGILSWTTSNADILNVAIGIKINHALQNGVSVLNIGYSNIPMKKFTGAGTVKGDFRVGLYIVGVYDGTNFNITSPTCNLAESF